MATEPDPFAGRTLQSLAKSLTHHTNRLRTRMDAAERLGIHVRIWPQSPAAARLMQLRKEMAEDWEQCGLYATAITSRLTSMMQGLDPRTLGVTSIKLGEVATNGHVSGGTAAGEAPGVH